MLLGWLFLTFSLCKAPLGETGCLGNPYFLLSGCLSIQFFDSPPFSQHSQLGCLWLPTPDCAAPMWPTQRHATPLVTRYIPPQSLTLSLTLPWPIARFLDFQASSSQSDSGYTRQDRRSFACGKDFNKKQRAAATLISSYEPRNQNNCSLQNAFQNMGALQNCSLEKWISKLLSKICA